MAGATVRPALYNNKSCCEGVLGQLGFHNASLTLPHAGYVEATRAEPGQVTSCTFTAIALSLSTATSDVDFVGRRTLNGQAHTFTHVALQVGKVDISRTLVLEANRR